MISAEFVNMSREFAKEKFAWALTVLADSKTRGLAHDVVSALAMKYLNFDRGKKAFPKVATLAAALSADRRSVQRALRMLEEAGFLKTKKSKGRRSNNYYMAIPNGGVDAAVEADDEQRRGRRPNSGVDAAFTPANSGVDAAHIREKGEGKGKRESGAARRAHSGPPSSFFREEGNAHSPSSWPKQASANSSGQKQSGQPDDLAKAKRPRDGRVLRARPFPEDWVCDIAEYKVAYELTKRAWDAGKVEAEFIKFKNYRLDKAPLSKDWQAAWRGWIQKGLEWEKSNKQHNKKKPLTGHDAAVEGVRQWYYAGQAYNGQTTEQPERPRKQTH
jgi:hypothetical protein